MAEVYLRTITRSTTLDETPEGMFRMDRLHGWYRGTYPEDPAIDPIAWMATDLSRRIDTAFIMGTDWPL